MFFSMAVVMEPHQTEQFAALWTAAQATVSAFIRTLIPDLHQADEVIQRVAVALVRKFDRYDPTRPFVAWAIGVAHAILAVNSHKADKRNRALIDAIKSGGS